MKKIPNHENIMAGLDGKIYDLSGNALTEYINGDGYRTVLVNTGNSFTTKGVHRLVAMTYKKTERNIDELLVNHLDLDKANNRPDNLEWTTSSENNIHAALMGVNSKTSRILATNGVNYALFKDCYELASHLDIVVEEAYRLVVDEKSMNGWSFKHRSTGESIPKELHKVNISKRNALGQAVKRPVSIVNIYSREILEFDSVASAARYLKVGTNFISQRISTDDLKLFSLEWMIFDGARDSVPELNESLLSSVMKGKKRQLVCRSPEGKTLLYVSAKAFYMDKNLSKKAVTSRLAKKGEASYRGYDIAYVGTLLAASLIASVEEVRA